MTSTYGGMMRPLLNEWLQLTAAERKVLLFLTGTFIIGLGVRLYQQTFPSVRTFDYTASDSTFAALSSTEPKDSSQGRPAGPLNINTASKDELVRLPGIGEVTAERILLYRDHVGPFAAVEDLSKVKGISKTKLEKLKPLVTVY